MALNRPPSGVIANPDLNALAIGQTWDGRTEGIGVFTLSTSSTSTTITHLAIKTGDYVFVNPTSMAAKAVFVATTFLVPVSTAADTCVVRHATGVAAGCTFAYHFHGK